MKYNASVVGGGTAGLIAAKKIASYGIETHVYDQKKRLGYPVRASGILSIKGLKGLGIDYSKCITNALYGANIHCDGKTMKIRSKKPIAHVLEREDLNNVCRDEAERAGAVIITGMRISGNELEKFRDEGVVMGADGAVSNVASHFKLGSIKRFALTYKAEFNVESEDSGVVELFFDNRIYKGLFAWLAPNAKDILEVGVGVDSRYGNAKSSFDSFIKSEYVKRIIYNKKMLDSGASVIPMGMRNRIVDEEKGVLLVGDAAGQVKQSTGGGIIFGGNAAIKAGEAVYNHMKSGSGLDEYEKAFRKEFGLDIRLHGAINRIYSSMGNRAFGNALSVMNRLGIDKFLGAYGDMDRPSLILRRFFLRSLA